MKFPTLFPSYKEMSRGWRYFVFKTAFLSYFLSLAIYFLRIPFGSNELNLTFFVVNFVVVICIFHRFLRNALRLPARRIPWILLIAVVGFAMHFLLSAAVSLLIGLIDPHFSNINNANFSGLSQKYYWLTAFCSIFLIPTTEELLHRGAIFGILYRKNRFLAYLASTLSFALIHITAYIGDYPTATILLCYLQYIPAGLCLTAAYDLSGSILTPILIHTAINAVGIIAMR